MIVKDRAGAIRRDPLIRWLRGVVFDLTRDCGIVYVRGRDKRACLKTAQEYIGRYGNGRLRLLVGTARSGRRAFNKRYVEQCWYWDFVVTYGYVMDATNAYVECWAPAK